MDKKLPKFITTTFVDTAKQLEEQGFTLLSHSGNVWTFLNNSELELFDYQKIVFTDKINI